MKAIILAANDNTRLRPLNLRKPSALIKINGISLLEHQIRGYSRAGVETDSIAVVAGYQHGQVKRFLKGACPAIRVVKNDDYRLASAARSLHIALESLEFDDADEGLFVSSGVCASLSRASIGHHCRHGACRARGKEQAARGSHIKAKSSFAHR